MKTALITGATSGIGWATAIELAQKGYFIIATGRRDERLNKLKSEIGENCMTVNFDVREKDEIDMAFQEIYKTIDKIDVLINNAGNAHGLDSIQHGEIDDWDAMIDINVKGLLYVTKKVLPNMIEEHAGHIVNIGSIAGKEAYPNGNVYCASKFAVDALSKTMRIDLNGTGIRVSQVCPGLVETEFSKVRFKGDVERASQVYEGYAALQANDIAELISFMVTRPAHVNIADVLILPTAQASATVLTKE